MPININDPRPISPSKNTLVWIVGIGLLMENIDATIINTAIPQMAYTLHQAPLNLRVSITSYLLALAAFIPISGYIADKYGTKRTFSSAMIVFLIGSSLCGFAHSLFFLVVGRFIQGIGGAMMTPVGRLILIKAFPKSELVKAFSYLTFFGQFGPALGPVLGGIFTTFVNWRFIFFVNVPIGLIALFFIFKYLPNEKEDNIPKFDSFGFVIFGVGASLITFSLSLLSETEEYLPLYINVIMLLLGLIFLILYYFYSQQKVNPALDLKLFRMQTFRIAVLGSALIRLSVGGIPLLLPLLFQLNFGLNAFQASLRILPYGAAMFLAKLLVKPLLYQFGFKKCLITNTLLISSTLCGLSQLTAHTNPILVSIDIFLLGILSSLQFTFMNILNFVDVSKSNISKATSLSSVFQQLTMSFGVCVSTGLLVAIPIMRGQHTYHHFIPIQTFHITFLILGLLTLVSLSMFTQLKNSDGLDILK